MSGLRAVQFRVFLVGIAMKRVSLIGLISLTYLFVGSEMSVAQLSVSSPTPLPTTGQPEASETHAKSASEKSKAKAKKHTRKKAKEESRFEHDSRLQTVTVIVPRSQLIVPPQDEMLVRKVELEVSVSSWEPVDFARESYVNGVTPFAKNDVPFLSLNRVGEFARLDSGLTFASKLGLSYIGLKRTTLTNFGGVSSGISEEDLNLFMARVGLEMEMTHLLPWGLGPALGVAVLPTWESAPVSVMEDGASGYGFPYEVSLGLLWRTNSRVSSIHGDISFGVEGQLINGTVNGSSVNGTGISGAFRMSI